MYSYPSGSEGATLVGCVAARLSTWVALCSRVKTMFDADVTTYFNLSTAQLDALVFASIANEEFGPFITALSDALIDTSDKHDWDRAVTNATHAVESILKVVAAVKPVENSITFFENLAGLIGMSNSVVNLLDKADGLEMIVRSIANYASLTSVLATGVAASTIATKFHMLGSHLNRIQPAASELVGPMTSIFKLVKSLGGERFLSPYIAHN